MARPGDSLPFPVAPTIDDPVVVGRFNAAFGIKGWIKVQSFTDPPEQLFDYDPWFILLDKTYHEIHCESCKPHQAHFAVSLKNCLDRNMAEILSRRDIIVSAAQLPVLEDHEFYWRDLIGLTVINQDGTVLGIIDHLFETGSNDVLVVKGDKERLIPYLLEDVIRRIDLQAGEMHVMWDLDL